ncbi:sugar phosphate isomerase/epimerase family protein [Lutispora thermophila]|uniref:Sugar phosphate isomerase/epimerase n=1 Tax=Lutispora thermophila DSM 19022 TaxID=1122184 RepID=A0A1M6HDP3_9FIRM|nr:sugar phosphate isomerase/epimerase family protein [Lutispora thermophila]SHJ20340.1 Sugar phosphate isomerase/epimerase [Lutispora thermophila DSM 19022]
MKFSVYAIDRDLPPSFPFPLRGSSYEQCAAIAKELGYDGIELQIQDPSFYNGRQLKSMFDYYGIQVSAVTTGLAYLFEGMSMTHPDKKIRAATVERLKRQLDLAKELDSQILVGFIRGRKQPDWTDEIFEEILTESVAQVLEYAEEIQTVFVMEQINRNDGDVFCSTERTMEFLEKFNSDWLKYNGDTYHMATEDSDIPAAVRRSLSKLVLFHVSDVGRNLPDDKHFNFYEPAKVLKEVGYDQWVSIECKPLPTSYEACKQGIEYLRRVFL